MNEHIFTGIGFGPIQSGLFAKEAYESGNFKRIVIAEIDPKLVDAVRTGGGSYSVNVASFSGIETVCIKGIEIYNPSDEKDRKELVKALSQSTEIVTSLPSVDFYDRGDNSVVSLVAAGLQNSSAKATLVYTAENNNHAAEILEKKMAEKMGRIPATVQFLNTVIGKMSQVSVDKEEIARKGLKPIAPGIDRAFLVEEFNRILVTQCAIAGYKPGIEVFIEKEDLLPFEEAKLYGHNAIHALLAYLGAVKGYTKMVQHEDNPKMMRIARDAFLNESGAALIKKYKHLKDELFTEKGFGAYAEDLLARMTNRHLDDTIDRAARDPRRKLGLNDRIFGTMALCLRQGIEPKNLALGAMAGVMYLVQRPAENKLPENLHFKSGREITDAQVDQILDWIWAGETSDYRQQLIHYLHGAKKEFAALLD